MGLLGVFLSACGVGFIASGRLEERVRLLCAFTDTVTRFKIHTEYTHSDIFTVLKDIRDDRNAVLIDALLNIKSDWTKENIRSAISDAVKNDEELISDFFCGIGESDLKGQLSVCEKALGSAGQALISAREELAVKGRMYKTLGISAGLCAVFFFI